MSKNKKIRRVFRDKFRTISEIGMLFGMSAIAFGKLLKELGLREQTGIPSKYSLDNDFTTEVRPKNSPSYYMWNEEKVVNYIQENSTHRLSNLGENPKSHKIIEVIKMLENADKMDNDGDKFAYMLLEEAEEYMKEHRITKEQVNLELKRRGKQHLIFE